MIHHAEGLRRLTRDEKLVEQLKTDYRSASLEPRLRAMLDYARKLTLTPHEMEQSDIDPLRGAGLSDAAVLDLNMVVGYFAFVNRLADGLGVELEARWGEEG